MMQKIKSLALILGVLAMSILVGYFVLAWTGPGSTPPGGNVSAPLNVSVNAQSKEGALVIGTNSGLTTGLIVQYGKVGIGTTEPDTKLHVIGAVCAEASDTGCAPTSGDVRGTRLCIGSDCKNAWPAGGVTSVGLAMPTEYTVTNSPVTSSGTLTAAWNSQTANKVLAAPSGSSGTPSFRALTATDIPSLDAGKITTGTFADARIASAATWNTAYTHSQATTNVHGLTFTAEGSGGGLDADLLDGKDSSAFGDATLANQTTILTRIGTSGDTASLTPTTLFAGVKGIIGRVDNAYSACYAIYPIDNDVNGWACACYALGCASGFTSVGTFTTTIRNQMQYGYQCNSSEYYDCVCEAQVCCLAR